MAKIIFNADDLGLSKAFNRGVLVAYKEGLLSSTSIRVNTPFAEEAIREVLPQCEGLGYGVHIDIVEGRSCRTGSSIKKSRILNASGQFKLSFLDLLRINSLEEGSAVISEIKDEFRSQIEKMLSFSISPDHINTHQHSHVVPVISKIMSELAKEYSIPWTRYLREKYYPISLGSFIHPWGYGNLLKHWIAKKYSEQNKAHYQLNGIQCCTNFIGLLEAGHMNEIGICKALTQNHKEDDLVEILLHPVVPCENDVFVKPYLRDYINSKSRQIELNTLRSQTLREFLQVQGHTITNYETSK